MSSIGGNTATNKYIKFDKTEVAGKELNAMVKQYIMAALKGGKKKLTSRIAADIDTSSHDEAFDIDRINVAYSDSLKHFSGGNPPQ